ncbi:aminodeoxychorismate/anthranilate synthase component II [Acetobacterium fimetarium]|uniref:Aminodeoxychorismate/anthranilate synthase component II n=1 Tax=Acetobacterium fimetarium TaxID=52691 RepID=A0ABR6WVC2_9FIRM|nr:aminodeoxychorismate/anthranilate synthase component II [Acetobacterium fimetarium]MBC3804537.1 aminodeoxychorismate/anthranilate synthase component II [Acetobacterium fimetarium]
MILMIDNYDSFTYNLVQYLEGLSAEVVVKRNDKVTIDEIALMEPSMIVLSPGPCTPNESGICLEVVDVFKGRIPILGICLGHQIIAQAFGCRIVKAKEPVHGKVDAIAHNNTGVFEGLNNPLKVTRYHSLVVENKAIPDCFEITAKTKEAEIMGLKHREYQIEGVQFHPEAILTEMGMELLDNFFRSAKEKGALC